MTVDGVAQSKRRRSPNIRCGSTDRSRLQCVAESLRIAIAFVISQILLLRV
jgi:hypothetical protein